MTEYLTIDGHRIAYTSAGSASNPPVILIHGLMSHRGVWNSTIQKLQDRFYCIAIDLLGFGDSDKPQNGDYTIARQAERTMTVANHFGFDEFTVIGHSMGGQIATYLASMLAPQCVHKLISVDGAVTGKLTNKVQNITRRLVLLGAKFPLPDSILRIMTGWKPLACWLFTPWFYRPGDLPFDSWEVDRRMAVNQETVPSVLKAWDALNATDLTPHLKNIAAPTLIIFGKQDGTVPVDQAYLFKEKLPTAQLLVIDKCSHLPMYEKFDEYITSIESFLNEP